MPLSEDELSPFFGLSKNDLLEQNIELSISVMGYDETFSQVVHARCFYGPEDFEFEYAFQDMITRDHSKNTYAIDYTKFNLLKPAQK